MADGGKEMADPSLDENYDPLSDVASHLAVHQTSDHDADRSSDDDHYNSETPMNSLDGMLEDLIIEETDQMPFSPPTSGRLYKREKVRRNSGKKSQKEIRQLREMEKSKSMKMPICIKQKYTESNALFSGLGHVDSDVDLDRSESRAIKEKRKKDREDKLKSKTRQQEIFMKREDKSYVSENIASNTAPMDIDTPVVPIKLEGSGRYLTLGMTNKLSMAPTRAASSEQQRPTVLSYTECPNDRLVFFKTFQALINMGSQGKKQKEQKEKERMVPQRQKSSEEHLYVSLVWLGLQAWLNGMSLDEQSRKMEQEREKIPLVLEEIMKFKVKFPQNTGSLLYAREQQCVGDENYLMDISDTYHTMYSNMEMIQQQEFAVIQVERLLQKLDQCEQLFSTAAQFASDYPTYHQREFVHRTEALYLWLNTTKDLCHKMNVLGQVFNISANQGWLYVNFTPGKENDHEIQSRTDIPEIVGGGEEEEEEEEDDDDTGDDIDDDHTEQLDSKKKQSLSLTDACQSVEHHMKVKFQLSNSDSQLRSDKRLTSPINSPKRDLSPTTYGSPPDSSTPLRAPFSSTTLSRASSEASLDGQARSLYRAYVDKGLKKMGLNKMLIRLRDILYRSLKRARQSLEYRSQDMDGESPGEESHGNNTSASLHLLDKSPGMRLESHSTEKLHAWRQEFLDIGLPSYRPTYIFLLRVLLEVIHEAMKIRLEQLQNPIGDPSFLSIRQLIIECKDMLAKAVMVKQDYQCMVQAVLDDVEATAENSPLDVEGFDDDMSKMFKMYFQYLQNWLYHLQNLPEASRTLKNPLEEEWSFTKKICPHIIGGEAEAGKRFSTMAISLLNSISDFLESEVDECTTYMYDMTFHEQTSSSEDSEQTEEDHDTSASRAKSSSTIRRTFQMSCRRFQNLFREARERASKALGFAKLLRKDLEIAADFNIAVSMAELLQKLKESGHVNVVPQISMMRTEYLMFIPSTIADQRHHIIQLLNVTCGREDVSGNTDFSNRDNLPAYLLMVRCGSRAECPQWEGPHIDVEPTAETAIALSHIRVESLLLVVIHSSQLASQRKEFETMMGGAVELVNEQTSCHQMIVESLHDLKESAITLRDKVSTVIGNMEKNWNCDAEMQDHEKKHILKLYRETMLRAYEFGFEYMKEVTRLVSGETRHKLGPGSMSFAKDWMKFVSEKCERGRGMRPRWANQGLDFLLIACEPRNLAALTEQEYKDLQEMLNDFITHLIGNADKASHFGGSSKTRHSSETVQSHQYSRLTSWPLPHSDTKMSWSHSTKSFLEPGRPQTAPVTSQEAFTSTHLRTMHSVPSLDSSDAPDHSVGTKVDRRSDGNLEVDIHDGDEGGIVFEVHRGQHRASDSALNPCGSSSVFSYKPHVRIVKAIRKIEREREQQWREKRVIGRVTKHRGVSYHLNTRKVNFHWQKGNKIGEGQFGKVYSAVNMDSGVLMAMKEIKFPSADIHSHFKEIIDEIKIFEGISHENLVRYYGVEVHRTEMLVFMEYCDRGTIDEVSRNGLTEDLIRIYTKQLLCAAQVLHDNKIVHRDIKGANIFLTSSGCLKLGDFGCSVKLKNHTTMVGEMKKMVGTTAYMAPEVVTKNDSVGHGRAADIWSVGCVVIEMASGKRPWHECENHFQIVFKLGMGGTPTIPENLSAEGKDFLKYCLEQDPEKRWSASQLLDHPFAKIYDPERDNENVDESPT